MFKDVGSETHVFAVTLPVAFTSQNASPCGSEQLNNIWFPIISYGLRNLAGL